MRVRDRRVIRSDRRWPGRLPGTWLPRWQRGRPHRDGRRRRRRCALRGRALRRRRPGLAVGGWNTGRLDCDAVAGVFELSRAVADEAGTRARPRIRPLLPGLSGPQPRRHRPRPVVDARRLGSFRRGERTVAAPLRAGMEGDVEALIISGKSAGSWAAAPVTTSRRCICGREWGWRKPPPAISPRRVR